MKLTDNPPYLMILFICASDSGKEKILNSENKDVKTILDFIIFEDERSFPKILVKYGYFKSISEVRKNRPDLMITFNVCDGIINSDDGKKFKIGKKIIETFVCSDSDPNGFRWE